MANILVVYGTTEGQTRKIAAFIADVIRERGHTAELADSTAVEPVLGEHTFDGFIVGASVHQGHHQSSVTHFVQAHRTELERVPSAFFSVSMAAALDGDEDQEEPRRYVSEFLKETGWTPDVTARVAGALLYTKYDFFKRFLMKMISKRQGGPTDTSQDYEYTDWDQVTRFVEELLREIETHRASVAAPAQPEVRT